MAKKDKKASKGGDGDAGLWERIAGTISPLKNRGRAYTAFAKRAARTIAGQIPTPDVGAVSEPKPARKARATAPAYIAKPQLPPVPVPSSVELGRRQARALEKGRLAVEAKLDLHGMRQRDAHAALRRFLKESQGRGLRHVLVITGKGTERVSPDLYDPSEPRGVLRQAVPGWLAQPDLASVVVSFSEAPQRLGGAGALYVRLKRLRG